jgi:hypothetical protein
MGIVLGLMLIACGVLAASSLVIARRPDAAAIIERIRPVQGWLGVAALAWGLWASVSWILHASTILRAAPLWGVTWLAAAVAQIAIGFLLAYPLLSQHVLSRSAGAQAGAAVALSHIERHQPALGLFSIALGVWSLIASLVL